MKYALICPLISVETGYMVSDVADTSFDVADPLFWIQCDDSVTSQQYWYNPTTQEILPIPLPAPTRDVNNTPPVSEGTQTL